MRSLFGPVELVNEREIPLGAIQHITIGYISERIILREAPGDTIILKEYLSASSPELLAKINADSDMLTIHHGERSIRFYALRGHIEVYIPKNFFGALCVNSVSGSVQTEGRFVLSEIDLSTTSGRITADSVTAGTATFSSVSGTIDIGRLEAIANASSTSGSIHIDRAAGAGRFQSVSGSMHLSFEAVTGDIRAESTSGSIYLAVPKAMVFSLDAHSVSGKISATFPGTFSVGKHSLSGVSGASPKAHLDLKTVSGRVNVSPLG